MNMMMALSVLMGVFYGIVFVCLNEAECRNSPAGNECIDERTRCE